ncbi:MAG TPA: DedA family protein [Gammaproteobacteria bacterium]|nr:DedA family protein [Gammaproteobacteria bacterium]
MNLLDIVLHLDVHLLQLVQAYGVWAYAILFAIIFCETGLVVTPFLPGDSLLFVAGAIAAGGALEIHSLALLLALAAILGNTANFEIGRWLGPRLFQAGRSRWLDPRHLETAHAFYDRHGGKAVMISRFLPIVRTYIPFVAGLARMRTAVFVGYNVVGGALWAGSLCYAGYFFGNIPWVKGHLTLLILGIIAVSLVPLGVAWVRSRMKKG